MGRHETNFILFHNIPRFWSMHRKSFVESIILISGLAKFNVGSGSFCSFQNA